MFERSRWVWVAAISVVAMMMGTLAIAEGQSKGKGGGGGGKGGPADPAVAFEGPGRGDRWVTVVDADGRNKTYVAPKGGYNLSRIGWSPDGKQLVYGGDAEGLGRGVYVVNVDGTGLARITGLHPNSQPVFAATMWSPVAAPDGKFKILFNNPLPSDPNNHDLWLVNLDGTGLVNLTNTPDIDERQPTWAPDGRRLAATVQHRPDGKWREDIYLYELEKPLSGAVRIKSTVNLTNVPGWPVPVDNGYWIDWSRSGNRLAVSNYSDNWTLWDIWVFDVVSPVGPANPVNLTNGLYPGVAESRPTWSPDDSLIAFDRNDWTTKGHGIFVIEVATGVISPLYPKMWSEAPLSPSWRRNP